MFVKEVKEIDNGQIELTVEITFLELQNFLNQAAEKISRQTKIAGFRPGKAPYDVVKGKVGEMKIYETAMETAIPKTFVEVIKLKSLETVGQPQIKVEKLAPGNSLVYVATVALLPVVKLTDYKNIKVVRKEIKIESREIDEVLKNLSKMRAEEKLVDRSIQKNDKVEVNFEMSITGAPTENGQHQNYPLIVGENRLAPGFEDQLIGLKAGEKKEFSLKFPANHFDKKLAGQEVDFKVEVKAVYERELPALNDEFAKSLGQFADLPALKKQIGDNLKQEKEVKEEQRLEGEIFDKIIKTSEFGIIPEILLASERHKMLHELEATIENQGFKFDDYLKGINKTHDDLEKGFAESAERRVKSALVSREIAKREKIEIQEDETEKEAEEILKSYSNNPEIAEHIRSKSYRDYLKNVIANRKVMELLKKEVLSS